MKKALYCGIDLHSNNAVYFVLDEKEETLFKKRLPNDLDVIRKALEPFPKRLKSVAVESTYNWHWLIDGPRESGYPVCLAKSLTLFRPCFESLGSDYLLQGGKSQELLRSFIDLCHRLNRVRYRRCSGPPVGGWGRQG